MSALNIPTLEDNSGQPPITAELAKSSCPWSEDRKMKVWTPGISKDLQEPALKNGVTLKNEHYLVKKVLNASGKQYRHFENVWRNI